LNTDSEQVPPNEEAKLQNFDGVDQTVDDGFIKQEPKGDQRLKSIISMNLSCALYALYQIMFKYIN